MSKMLNLTRLKERLRSRGEDGAGALLPIIIVGVLVISIAASVNLAVTFSSKTSALQIDQTVASTSNSSLLNSFEADIYASNLNTTGGPALKSTATVADTGSYTVYYSTAATAPTSTTSAGVTPLGSSTLPANALWIVVQATPIKGTSQTAVFSYTKKASTSFDSLTNWYGPVKIATSTLQNAPGNLGPVSLVARDPSAAAATSGLSITNSTVSADLYATYSSAQTAISAGTIKGNIYSKPTIQFQNTPQILGNVASGGSVNGAATVAGTSSSTSSTLPAAPGKASNKVYILGTTMTLAASDCSSPAALKAKLESLTTPTTAGPTGAYGWTITNMDVCTADSWNTEIKPKTNILLSSTKALTVSGLKVTGGHLDIHSTAGLSLTNTTYQNGAIGQILSQGNITVRSSSLNGTIANYGTAGSTLDMADSTVLFTPMASQQASCDSAGANCTSAGSSSVVHLLRVS